MKQTRIIVLPQTITTSLLMRPRLMLTNERWSKLKSIMLENGIYDKQDLRLTTEGILYRLRTGIPWRDLPDFFGNWNSIYKRFHDWSCKDKLISVFKSLIGDGDPDWKFIDSTIVRAHQHSSGAPHGQESGIGKSKGGNTTKIHLVVELHGYPIEFKISEGQRHDCYVAPELLIELPPGGYTVGDKGYSSDPLRNFIKDLGSTPVIPRKENSKVGNDDIDWGLYRFRHLVENMFARLKHFRGFATRYEKLAKIFEGTVALACAYVWL